MPQAKVSRIDRVFALISFGVLVASILIVLLFGAGVYKSIAEKSQEGYGERMCHSYIWTKIKNGDSVGRVYTGEFCGLSALFLEEEYEGTIYLTTIYLYDGWVRELFSEAGLEFSPEAGLPVIEANTLVFEQLEGGLIRVDVNSEIAFVYPRSS